MGRPADAIENQKSVVFFLSAFCLVFHIEPHRVSRPAQFNPQIQNHQSKTAISRQPTAVSFQIRLQNGPRGLNQKGILSILPSGQV
jgi:hypothetical protein